MEALSVSLAANGGVVICRKTRALQWVIEGCRTTDCLKGHSSENGRQWRNQKVGSSKKSGRGWFRLNAPICSTGAVPDKLR